MNIEIIEKNGDRVAVIYSDKCEIYDCASALDFMMNIKYNSGCSKIAINKEAVCDEFFILSTCLAGEILQKFINYGVKLAIIGDYTKYTSKPLHDFIYESNKGEDFFFVDDKQQAIKKLIG